jgi:hypothetical protein
MKNTITRKAALLAVVLSTLMLAACGGGDDDEDQDHRCVIDGIEYPPVICEGSPPHGHK